MYLWYMPRQNWSWDVTPRDPTQILQEQTSLTLLQMGVGVQKIYYESWDLGSTIQKDGLKWVGQKMNAGDYNTKAKQGKHAIWSYFSVVTDKDGNQQDLVRNVQKY